MIRLLLSGLLSRCRRVLRGLLRRRLFSVSIVGSMRSLVFGVSRIMVGGRVCLLILMRRLGDLG